MSARSYPEIRNLLFDRGYINWQEAKGMTEDELEEITIEKFGLTLKQTEMEAEL